MAGILLSIAGFCALVQSVQAQAGFTDTNRDLMLICRKTGFDGSADIGNYVFEVDIGQASIYYGATAGSSIPVSAYTTAQLSGLFDNLNDFSWSIIACVPNYGDNGNPSKPIGTLWLTDPHTAGPATPSPAWQRESIYVQKQTGGQINSILQNALTYAGSASPSSDNTATTLAIPTGSGYSANDNLTALGNFGAFQGDVEITTLATFTTDGLPSICDFYELQPGSGSGAYLGYFELSTNGALTFYAGSSSVSYPAPTLTVSTAGSSTVNIAFSSTANGTYTLYYTNAAGLKAPISTWASVSTNIVGDGTVKSFQQPISGAGTFYSVGVH
jgi:hypothetical protein